MKLETCEDLKLPHKQAWRAVTNFDGFEALIRDRGGEIERSDDPSPPGLGTTWRGTFSYNGTLREVTGEITRFDAPDAMTLMLTSTGLEGTLDIVLTEKGKSRTQTEVSLTVAARTLKAKLVIQPMKLAHGTIQARFAGRVAKLARALEKKRKGI